MQRDVRVLRTPRWATHQGPRQDVRRLLWVPVIDVIELTPRHIELFHSKVDRSGACWLWTGEVNSSGYGRVALYNEGARTRVLAHRMAFLLATGGDPLVVRHDCDTPRCVRPDHLQPGTQADNIRDALDRGRMNLAGLEEYRRMRDQRAIALAALPTKTCKRCATEKPKEQFYAATREIDGKNRWCKACMVAAQRDRRRRRREQRAARRAA